MKFTNLFLLVSLTTITAQAQIKFESVVTQNPIVFNIVFSRCDGGVCSFSDTQNNLRITTSWNDSYQYNLFNSQVQLVNTISIEPQASSTLIRSLEVASISCPTRVVVDRNSMKIAEVTPSCLSPTGNVSMKLVSIRPSYLPRADRVSRILYDANGSLRLRYNSDTGIYSIIQYPSPNTYTIAPQEKARFELYLRSARFDCPLNIEYKVETGEIVKAKLGCDPLAMGLIGDYRRG